MLQAKVTIYQQSLKSIDSHILEKQNFLGN